MKARYAYPLLFLPACAMAAVIAVVLSGAAMGGVLWLFVYGDDPWPAGADAAVVALAACVGIAVLVVSLAICHGFGKRQESTGGLRTAHVAFAVALTVLLPLLVLLHQWQVGNIGNRALDPSIRQYHAAPRR